MKIQLPSGPAPGVPGQWAQQVRMIESAPISTRWCSRGAGGIGRGTEAIAVFAAWPVPMLYLAVNHEFYGHGWD